MKVLVDADHCPRSVLNLIHELSGKYGYKILTVASFNHNIEGKDHIIVGDEPQAADMEIANCSSKGDIVVTGDWGLASLVLGKGARAISPSGKIYKAGLIEFLLEERHLKAKIRQGGGRTKGPSARTTEDDKRFKESFIRLLEIGSEK